jgi:uncharacterized protein
MMKYLLVVAVVVGVLWLLTVQRRRQRGREQRPGGGASATGPAPSAKRAQAPPAAEMVACAHCGVHLPRPDALERDALPYCSAEHRAAGPARSG